MRKFIDRITPSFILAYNDRLLKNAPLGWQLQLPVITWIWLLVSLLTLPIPFLVNLDARGEDDIVAVILVTVLTAVLEGILFTYILIQFNNTKTFGHRVFLNGFKEHFGYLYVFMLCVLNIIFYPLIVDIRKSNLMTAEEIRAEAVIYNQASFYFMGESSAYRYFPSEASFLHYNYLAEYRNNYDESSNTYAHETYYIEKLKPLMQPYFLDDSERIDARYTRDVSRCPKLYMIEGNNLNENYYNYESPFYKAEMDTLYYERYQLQDKSDAERLKDISAFIRLYTIYTKYNGDEGYTEIHFDAPEQILQRYKSNRFKPVFYEIDDLSTDYPVMTEEGEIANDTDEQLSGYRISGVHSTIAEAGHYKWKHCVMRLLVCFFVALGLSILLYAFKNVRLKEFILMFVYTGLLALVVAILNVLFNGDEDFPIHVVLIVFFTGIYFSFFDRNLKHFSSIKTIFVLLSNLAFAFAPAALFIYFHEYHDLGKIPDHYEYCLKHAAECEKHDQMVYLIRYTCLWGGIALYMFLGSTLYKRVYERLWALPFAK